MPYFSVVIPTKNRPFLVGYAVQSVLDQTFGDFEIIIADNDDTSDTVRALERYSDPRIRVVRTGGLNMADNWESAFAAANGTYQLLLEDKSVLKPRALATIHAALQKHPAKVVSWPQDLFNDLLDPPVVNWGHLDGACRLYSSDEVIQFFMTLPRGYFETTLPRGLNSCLHRDLKAQILQSAAGRLCPPYSPDYTMAFLQLRFADEILNINDCLTVYGSCKHSHGRIYLWGERDQGHLKKDFGAEGDEVFYQHTPIKARILSSALYHEYIRMAHLVGGRLDRIPVSPRQLFVESWRDIRIAQGQGLKARAQVKAWKQAYYKQPAAVRAEIREELRKDRAPRTALWRVAGKALGLHYPWRFLKKHLGWKSEPLGAVPSTPAFHNALEYVRWEKDQVQNVL